MIKIIKCVDDYIAWWTIGFDPDFGDLNPINVKAYLSGFDEKKKPIYVEESVLQSAQRNEVVLFLCNDIFLKSLPENRRPKHWWIKNNYVKALEWVYANEAANYIEKEFDYKKNSI